jgi:hypothetical protein
MQQLQLDICALATQVTAGLSAVQRVRRAQ